MFKPTTVPAAGSLPSILHLTDKDINTSSYGGRVPAVWFNSRGKLWIECSKNNTGNRGHSLRGPQVGKWTQITFIQEDFLGKSRYRVLIDGVEKYNVENVQDKSFYNVRVYASNPWHSALHGYIKNLSIKGKV